MLIVWGLIDERIGSSKQTIILANKLTNNQAIFKRIEYNKFIILPNILKFKTTGINFKKSDSLTINNLQETPDIIIFAGRRLAGLALYLKEIIYKNFNKKIKLISILNPNYNFKLFDFIILPKHDNINHKQYNNIIAINGSICDLDKKIISKAGEQFRLRIQQKYKQPCYCLLIGGNSGNKQMNIDKFKIFIKNLNEKIKEDNGSLLLSTSRRTDQKFIEIIKNNLTCNNYVYEWKKNDKNNPYSAFLSLGDKFIVTADSISMITEIITLNKMTYVYIDNKALKNKHKKFIDLLYKQGIIKKIYFSENKFQNYDIPLIQNNLDQICKRIINY